MRAEKTQARSIKVWYNIELAHICCELMCMDVSLYMEQLQIVQGMHDTRIRYTRTLHWFHTQSKQPTRNVHFSKSP